MVYLVGKQFELGACRSFAWRQEAKKLLNGQEALNRSQQEAIAKALTRTVTLWQARRVP